MLRMMSWQGNTLKIAALWAVSALACGQAADPQTATASPVAPVAPFQPAPPERHWRLGAAVGYGERSNPLIQSEDIPVLIDLDIAWFGKRWFFDNGDVGVTLFDGPSPPPAWWRDSTAIACSSARPTRNT